MRRVTVAVLRSAFCAMCITKPIKAAAARRGAKHVRGLSGRVYRHIAEPIGTMHIAVGAVRRWRAWHDSAEMILRVLEALQACRRRTRPAAAHIP